MSSSTPISFRVSVCSTPWPLSAEEGGSSSPGFRGSPGFPGSAVLMGEDAEGEELGAVAPAALAWSEVFAGKPKLRVLAPRKQVSTIRAAVCAGRGFAVIRLSGKRLLHIW